MAVNELWRSIIQFLSPLCIGLALIVNEPWFKLWCRKNASMGDRPIFDAVWVGFGGMQLDKDKDKDKDKV